MYDLECHIQYSSLVAHVAEQPYLVSFFKKLCKNINHHIKKILLSEYTGHENLEKVSQTDKFNKWIFEKIKPGIRGDILEVGSGLGTFSKKIIRDFPNSKITLTEISEKYINDLKKNETKNISVFKLNLNDKNDYEKIGFEKFNSIIAINVLEHVENDEYALQMLYKLLKKDGKLIIFVPCYKFLFNVIDSSIGHFRRYTKNELEKKLKETGFKNLKIFNFNVIGIIGWYLNGNLRKNPNFTSQ